MREIGLTLHSSSIWPTSGILRLKTKCTKDHFLICNDWQKNERHKPAAQDVHHCASQLWVKDEEEERVDEGVHEGHVDRHLMEVVIKKLAAIRCVLEILRNPK